MRQYLLGIALLGSLVVAPRAEASGAMSATALGNKYTAQLVELSYAWGEDPPPSQSYIDGQLASMRQRVAGGMPTLDTWIATEEKAGAITPVEISVKTAMVELQPTTQRTGTLSRPALVGLPPCNTALSNLSVIITLALPYLPSAAMRAKLGERMCAALKKADASPPLPTPFVVTKPLTQTEPTMRHALESGFIVSARSAESLAKRRDAFFGLARASTMKSLLRYTAEHPGTRIVAPDSPNSQTVRFSMHTAIGTYDLFLGIAGAKGSHDKVDVSVKDAISRDWQADGLPIQTQLDTLLAKP